MSDVNANIGVHIDTSAALTELKALQKQLALFYSNVAKGSAAKRTKPKIINKTPNNRYHLRSACS